MSDKIWFSTNISLVESIKFSGIDLWNDHINERMNVSWPLQELSSTQVGEKLYCEGCIPLEDLSSDELSDVIDSFLSTSRQTNVHIVAICLIVTAKSYIFNSLEEGMTLVENMGQDLRQDDISNINMNINNELFLSAIPYSKFFW